MATPPPQLPAPAESGPGPLLLPQTGSKSDSDPIRLIIDLAPGVDQPPTGLPPSTFPLHMRNSQLDPLRWNTVDGLSRLLSCPSLARDWMMLRPRRQCPQCPNAIIPAERLNDLVYAENVGNWEPNADSPPLNIFLMPIAGSGSMKEEEELEVEDEQDVNNNGGDGGAQKGEGKGTGTSGNSDSASNTGTGEPQQSGGEIIRHIILTDIGDSQYFHFPFEARYLPPDDPLHPYRHVGIHRCESIEEAIAVARQPSNRIEELTTGGGVILTDRDLIRLRRAMPQLRRLVMTAGPVGFSERGLKAILTGDVGKLKSSSSSSGGSSSSSGIHVNVSGVEEFQWEGRRRWPRPSDLDVLASCSSSLKLLDLSFNGVDASMSLSAAYASTLSQLHQLRNLSLTGLIDPTVLAAIASLHQLEVLLLKGDMVAEYIPPMAESVSLMRHRREPEKPLDLSPIANLTQLRALSIQVNDYQPPVDVSTFLPSLSNLTHLQLAHCVWGDAGENWRFLNNTDKVIDIFQHLHALSDGPKLQQVSLPPRPPLSGKLEVAKLAVIVLSIPTLNYFSIDMSSFPDHVFDKMDEMKLPWTLPQGLDPFHYSTWFKVGMQLTPEKREQLRQVMEEYMEQQAAKQSNANANSQR